MRIGIDARAIGPHFPGISRATLGMLRGLQAAEHDEQIVVVHNPSQRELVKVAGLGRDARFHLLEATAGPLGLRQQWQIPLNARSARMSLWHAPYYFRPFALLPPTVVSIFDIIGPASGLAGSEDSRRARGARLLWQIAMRLSLGTAAHVITASEAAMRDLQTTFGVPRAKLTVIPLAADDRFRPQPESVVATSRQRYDLPRHYVLYLGSNKPHKNIRALIDAWARLLHRQIVSGSGSPTWLVIAGHVDPRFSLAQKRVLEHGVASTVRFLPDVADDDLPALLSGALCFVYPSLHEGFGLPPLEAMACGTPVIASNRTSLPEVVGDAGLLVDPEPEALAAAIARLIGDADLRLALQARGLERAAGFSWKRTATETLQVYREVARRCVATRKVPP